MTNISTPAAGLVRLIPFLKPYVVSFVGSFVCRAINLSSLIFVPYLLRHAIDEILAGQTNRLPIYLLTCVVLIVASNVCLYYAELLSVTFGTNVITDLREQMATRIQTAQFQALNQNNTGDLLSRISYDVEELNDLLKVSPFKLLQPMLLVAGAVYLATLNWQLLLISCLLMPVASVLSGRLTKPVEAFAEQRSALHGNATAVISETIGGIQVVKSFNLQPALQVKFDAVLQSITNASIKLDRMRSGLDFVNLGLGQIPQMVVPVLGGYMVAQHEMTAGGLLAFNMLSWYVFRAARHILEYRIQWAGAKPSIARLVEVLDMPPERSSGTLLLQRSGHAPAIAFTHVDFSYPSTLDKDDRSESARVLSDINFVVDAGQTLAIVGASGSGKSTLLKLLCGFYEPESGAIDVFGQNLARTHLTSLRQELALVSQETFLFPATIGENIGYGRPNATIEDIMAAAKAAYAHNFIMRMPNGYGTVLAEFGTNLSGGQRQRIALARAILKDAPILLLDEPTAALDTASERAIQEALLAFTRSRTTVTIAHRLSTIQDAADILVLERGCIVERGTHHDLMTRGGVYFRLYQTQAAEGEHA